MPCAQRTASRDSCLSGQTAREISQPSHWFATVAQLERRLKFALGDVLGHGTDVL